MRRYRAYCFQILLGLLSVMCFSSNVRGATDILFLVDSTASMEGLNHFKTALSGILEAIDANSLCPETIMYGVADYRNYMDGGSYQAYGVNLVQPFTYSTQDTLSSINGLTKGDGGDTPESQLKAMVSITNNWLTPNGDLGFNGRTGAQKIIIWAGDAPGHIAGESPAGYYPALDEVKNLLTAHGIIVFALNPEACDSGLNELYAEHQQASEITAATGGILFCNVGSGSSTIKEAIIGAILCFSFTKDDDLNDENPADCRSPNQELTYTLCVANSSSQTIQNPYIIDWLPDGVDFPLSYTWDPNTMQMIPSDLNYDPNTHSYIWHLDPIAPNSTVCRQLTVVVNDKAEPGRYLHNAAELWGTVLVSDPNDPNNVIPVTRLIATVEKDTLVCCWNTNGILYVDKNATGNHTGVSWANAYTDLQEALAYVRSAVCGSINTIYVAQGPYSPGTDEGNSFELPDNISVYGGFPTGGCEFSQRNPEQHPTILSGRIDDTRRNETIVKMGDSTLLDGFTVTENSRSGYGIYGSGDDFIINQCTVEKNLGYGIYIEDGNATVRWCQIRNNEADGIYHQGEGYELVVENCWVRQSGRHSIRCTDSTPVILNSIITESDMAEEGRAGIYMENPTSQPVLQNVTCVHNKTEGVALLGSTMPSLINCIVYHNGGQALAGFSADNCASYSCIEGANLVNFNISSDPELAYFDPNNVRIRYESPCRDAGNPYLSYEDQVDMDNQIRSLGMTADIGAYEIECEDTSNLFDWNADGLVNLVEFHSFAKAWLTYDPNHPLCDPNTPGYVGEPNEPGYIGDEDKLRYNPQCDLDNDLHVGLSDFLIFCENWGWTACWLDLTEPIQSIQMLSAGGEMMMEMISSGGTEFQAIPEKSLQKQRVELAVMIAQLEILWLTEPDIQKAINPDDWNRFMNSVYQGLSDMQTESIQKEYLDLESL